MDLPPELVFIGLLFLVVLAAVVIQQIAKAAKKKKADEARKWADRRAVDLAVRHAARATVNVRKRFDSVDGTAGIGLDDETGLISLVSYSGDYDEHVYGSDDLIDVRLDEQISSVQHSRADRSSQLAGALVGELIAGNVGAIIGGSSPDRVTTTQQVCTRLELLVTMSDGDRPLWRIVFNREALAAPSPEYDAIKGQAMQWEAALRVLLRKSQRSPALAVAATRRADVRKATVRLALDAPGEPTFHVCRDGKDIGPMAVGRIVALIGAGKLARETDFYFDPQLDEWTPLTLLPS